jgi:hypothetical protein
VNDPSDLNGPDFDHVKDEIVLNDEHSVVTMKVDKKVPLAPLFQRGE